MSVACAECGAPVPNGGSCIDSFHALLALEHEVAADSAGVLQGAGEIAHFYAVSSYVLQHPQFMGYTREALRALRRNLARHLVGQTTLAELGVTVGEEAGGPVRVTRRANDEIPRWPMQAWPMTITDVMTGRRERYVTLVTAWACSIVRTLDAASPSTCEAP